MSCACDFEMPSFFDVATPRARKAHRCDECRRTIEPGETYQRITGKWDGDIATYNRCAHCHAAIVAIEELADKFDWCVCVSLGDARSQLRDFVREERWPNTAPIGRVVVAMERRWKRFDGKGLMDRAWVMR